MIRFFSYLILLLALTCNINKSPVAIDLDSRVLPISTNQNTIFGLIPVQHQNLINQMGEKALYRYLIARVDEQRNIYFLNTQEKAVFIYSADFQFSGKISITGLADQFDVIDGKLFIIDNNLFQVSIYRSDGRYLGKFPIPRHYPAIAQIHKDRAGKLHFVLSNQRTIPIGRKDTALKTEAPPLQIRPDISAKKGILSQDGSVQYFTRKGGNHLGLLFILPYDHSINQQSRDEAIRVHFKTSRTLGSITPIKTDRTGNIYLLVTYIEQEAPLETRSEIQAISPSGRRLKTFNLADYPRDPFDYDITPSGDIYIFRIVKQSIEIKGLINEKSL